VPVLQNSKHELFAQARAQGQSAAAAFVSAGYAPNDSNAARLNGNERVRARVEEIQAEAAAVAVKAIGVTLENVIGELAKIGFSDIRKLIRWSSNLTEVGEDVDSGEPIVRAFNNVALIDSDKLDDATAAAISEVSQTKDGALKVKMYDKKGALVDLGRHLGAFKDKVEHSGEVNLGGGLPDLIRRVKGIDRLG
jgi:phage terminase small subunit